MRCTHADAYTVLTSDNIKSPHARTASLTSVIIKNNCEDWEPHAHEQRPPCSCT